MKLNPKLLRYLTPEHFRVLTAVWKLNYLKIILILFIVN